MSWNRVYVVSIRNECVCIRIVAVMIIPNKCYSLAYVPNSSSSCFDLNKNNNTEIDYQLKKCEWTRKMEKERVEMLRSFSLTHKKHNKLIRKQLAIVDWLPLNNKFVNLCSTFSILDLFYFGLFYLCHFILKQSH